MAKQRLFSEIKTDYVDDNDVIHLDGYRTDNDDEEGVIIGYFIKGEIYWTDSEFQFDPYVKEVVEELKEGYKSELPLEDLNVVINALEVMKRKNEMNPLQADTLISRLNKHKSELIN